MLIKIATRAYVIRFLKSTGQIDENGKITNPNLQYVIAAIILRRHPEAADDKRIDKNTSNTQNWKRFKCFVEVEIPNYLIKRKHIDNQNARAYVQLAFANYIKREIYRYFIESLKVIFIETITTLNESIELFYNKYDLDEDVLPSINLRKQWQRKKGYSGYVDNRMQRYLYRRTKKD